MLISRGRRTDGVNTDTGTCSTQKMKRAFFCFKEKPLEAKHNCPACDITTKCHINPKDAYNQI